MKRRRAKPILITRPLYMPTRLKKNNQWRLTALLRRCRVEVTFTPTDWCWSPLPFRIRLVRRWWVSFGPLYIRWWT